MDMGAVVVGFFAILILFIVCNFLVTSITDGDGTLKQVYMIPAYGIMPLMICMIVTTIMSYQLTYNESFILTVIMMIGGIWSIAVIFEGLSTVHDYDFKQTVVSLIIYSSIYVNCGYSCSCSNYYVGTVIRLLNHSRKGDNKKCYRQLKRINLKQQQSLYVSYVSFHFV